MSTKLRQVSKEEFEVLTRFHPGEVRYYVDVGKALNTRNKGARISVKREPVAKKRSKKTKGRAINGTGRGINKPLMFTGKDAGYVSAHSYSKKVETAVGHLFESDPLRIIGRMDLAKMVVRDTNLHKNSVAPVISDLIRRGTLAVRTDS